MKNLEPLDGGDQGQLSQSLNVFYFCRRHCNTLSESLGIKSPKPYIIVLRRKTMAAKRKYQNNNQNKETLDRGDQDQHSQLQKNESTPSPIHRQNPPLAHTKGRKSLRLSQHQEMVRYPPPSYIVCFMTFLDACCKNIAGFISTKVYYFDPPPTLFEMRHIFSGLTMLQYWEFLLKICPSIQLWSNSQHPMPRNILDNINFLGKTH